MPPPDIELSEPDPPDIEPPDWPEPPIEPPDWPDPPIDPPDWPEPLIEPPDIEPPDWPEPPDIEPLESVALPIVPDPRLPPVCAPAPVANAAHATDMARMVICFMMFLSPKLRELTHWPFRGSAP